MRCCYGPISRQGCVRAKGVHCSWIASGQVHRVNVLDSGSTVLTPEALSSENVVSVPA